MEYLVRKISEAKWKHLDFDSKDDISADAITGGCLRTHLNRLSLWKCKNDKADIDEAVLAIVSSMQLPEKINIVLIENEFFEKNFIIEQTKGNTPIADLRDRHIDIAEMTMKKICLLAERIALKVRSNIDFHRYSKKQLVDLVKNAVISGRLKRDDLEAKIRYEIEKKMS